MSTPSQKGLVSMLSHNYSMHNTDLLFFSLRNFRQCSRCGSGHANFIHLIEQNNVVSHFPHLLFAGFLQTEHGPRSSDVGLMFSLFISRILFLPCTFTRTLIRELMSVKQIPTTIPLRPLYFEADVRPVTRTRVMLCQTKSCDLSY